MGEEEVVFDGFEDECVFEGEGESVERAAGALRCTGADTRGSGFVPLTGDHQFDVYRSMRDHVEASAEGWEGFHPLTNVMVRCSHTLSLSLLRLAAAHSRPATR